MDRPRRKRARPAGPADDSAELCGILADPATKVLVFTGSGISVAAGLSAFSTAGGLYEKARKRYKLKAGKVPAPCTFYLRMPQTRSRRPGACTSLMATPLPGFVHLRLLREEAGGL